MLRFTDQRFDDRVAAHINLSNEQLKGDQPHHVASSATFAAARFNAWLFARNNATGPEMAARREEAIEMFTKEFRQIFIEQFDDYVTNFKGYFG